MIVDVRHVGRRAGRHVAERAHEGRGPGAGARCPRRGVAVSEI
jgi:hypothetical protein